jgi:L-fuconolactonase
MLIDAHLHLWRRARGDYGWLTPELGPLWRDFEPEDAAAALAAHRVDRALLVQAAPTAAETCHLLAIAKAAPWAAGVVGWADLEAPDAADQIAALAAGEPLLTGLRPMIQDLADPDWMLQPTLGPGLRALAHAGLTFDALVLPPHLPRLRRFATRYPDLRIVIDHAAKPRPRAMDLGDWRAQMAGIAAESTAFCKLSGLATEIGLDWRAEEIAPILDHLLECFGPARLIWGSDWPVLLLAGDYGGWLCAARALIEERLSAGEAALVFGANAIAAYRLADG